MEGPRKADGSLRWKNDSNPLKNIQKTVKRHWETCHPVSKFPFCSLNLNEHISFVHHVDEDNTLSSSSSESDKFSTDSE